jgi:hypothetical protein
MMCFDSLILAQKMPLGGRPPQQYSQCYAVEFTSRLMDSRLRGNDTGETAFSRINGPDFPRGHAAFPEFPLNLCPSPDKDRLEQFGH